MRKTATLLIAVGLLAALATPAWATSSSALSLTATNGWSIGGDNPDNNGVVTVNKLVTTPFDGVVISAPFQISLLGATPGVDGFNHNPIPNFPDNADYRFWTDSLQWTLSKVSPTGGQTVILGGTVRNLVVRITSKPVYDEDWDMVPGTSNASAFLQVDGGLHLASLPTDALFLSDGGAATDLAGYILNRDGFGIPASIDSWTPGAFRLDPVLIPEPVTMLGLVAGIGAAFGYLRRRTAAV
jgi:hypothetical protein